MATEKHQDAKDSQGFVQMLEAAIALSNTVASLGESKDSILQRLRRIQRNTEKNAKQEDIIFNLRNENDELRGDMAKCLSEIARLASDGDITGIIETVRAEEQKWTAQ